MWEAGRAVCGHQKIKLGGIRDFVTGFETRAMAVIVWGPINNK